MRAEAEFTIEPFVEGAPGGHVMAGLDAVRAAGLPPDVGPFGTTIHGDLARITAAVLAVMEASPAPAPRGSRSRCGCWRTDPGLASRAHQSRRFRSCTR